VKTSLFGAGRQGSPARLLAYDTRHQCGHWRPAQLILLCFLPAGNIWLLLNYPGSQMRHLRRVSLAYFAVLATLVCHAAFAQLAFLPPTHMLLATVTARSIADCEVQHHTGQGQTEKFLQALEAASPGLFENQAMKDIAGRLLRIAATAKIETTQAGCAELISAATAVPEKVACFRTENAALNENKNLHGLRMRAALEKNGGAVPCLGMCAGLPGEDVRGSSSCTKAAREFVVACIEPGGPAELAGIRDQDEVVSINDHRLVHSLDFEVALLAAAPGQQVKVVIRRAGVETTHTLVAGKSRIMPGESDACRILR
jgi:PDZ domain